MIDLTTEEVPARKAYRNATERRAAARAAQGKDPETPTRRRALERVSVAQHSSESWEHYTPVEVIEPATRVCGGFDLDPCSHAVANSVVGARVFYSLQDGQDGLVLPWDGTVWLNPPGGRTSLVRPELHQLSKSYPAIWWARLIEEYMAGRVKEAFFLVFQLNLLQSIQQMTKGDLLFKFPICFFRKRIQYLYPEDTHDGYPKPGTDLIIGTAPPGASALVYLPPKEDFRKVRDFVEEFKKMGAVK